ncbi:MAG TPA: hypothetical protein VLT62_08030 [Candidatus Methylomirabilis sp.]|nr:hypothetical protein [Candidatus Methylomirabilis sp.]
MKNTIMAMAVVFVCVLISSAAMAGEQTKGLTLSASSSVVDVLKAAMSNKAHVFIHLKNGQEYSTKIIRDVSNAAVVIGEPSRREFYDVFIAIESIAAVEVRVRDK